MLQKRRTCAPAQRLAEYHLLRGGQIARHSPCLSQNVRHSPFPPRGYLAVIPFPASQSGECIAEPVQNRLFRSLRGCKNVAPVRQPSVLQSFTWSVAARVSEIRQI